MGENRTVHRVHRCVPFRHHHTFAAWPRWRWGYLGTICRDRRRFCCLGDCLPATWGHNSLSQIGRGAVVGRGICLLWRIGNPPEGALPTSRIGEHLSAF